MRTSTSYAFTIPASERYSSEKLKELRKAVAMLNPLTKHKHQVHLRGRLGRNNPKAVNYTQEAWRQKGSAGCHSHQNIATEDATTFDVYVYRVYA